MILKKNFVKSEEVENILNLGRITNKGVLLYGPAGHGKSEMVRQFILHHFQSEDVFIQSFGEGMSEDRLYGGLDFNKFNEEGILEFFPQNSFLAKKAVIFEEIFDAPPVVLLSLKDTLTSKKLNNGNQVFPMETEFLVAITNKNPAEIAQLGDAYEALVERFPLQFELKWSSYKSKDYEELFKTVRPGADKDLIKLLAGITSSASEKQIISPRKAVHALDVLLSIENINGSITKEDYINLSFIPGYKFSIDSIKEKIEYGKLKEKNEKYINDFSNRLEEVVSSVMNSTSPIKILKAIKVLEKEKNSFEELKFLEGFLEVRERLLNKTIDKIYSLKDRAVEVTK